MIRAVDNKRLELNSEEYGYYLKLIDSFGEEDFRGLFTSDRNGQITSITPPVDRQISLGVIFFILNVMMNQRLRSLGSAVKKNEKKVAEEPHLHNIEERLAHVEAQLEKMLGGTSE